MRLLRCYPRFSPRHSRPLTPSFPPPHPVIPAPSPRHSRFLTPSFPLSSPVIPAKAGIQTLAAKPVARNQVQIPTSGSLSLYGLTGVGLAFRSSGGHRNRERGERRSKLAIRNQVRIAACGSLLPLWEKARMRVRRAQARRCGRDARAPSPPFSPVIPAKAGIQTLATKPVARNQVQIPTSGSLLPLWERARMRVSPRASAALRARRPRSQPALLPRHSCESGNPDACNQARRPKPSTNPNQRIPSPFMGEG